jgi:hypothetical protein
VNYAATASGAAKQIADKGTPIIIRRPGASVYDPASGKNVTTPAVDYPGVAIVSGYKDFFINGTSIKAGDKRFTVAASGLGCVPTTTDKLIQAGKPWTIVNVDTVGPGGVPILFKVQARA